MIGLILLIINFAGAEEAVENAANYDGSQQEGPLVIKIYQKYISGIGERCSMYPSCSHYSSQAIKNHGWFKGWVMSCDRLIRCGRDESKFSHPIMVNGRPHTYDPLNRNDIWESHTSWNPHPSSTP